MKGSYIACGGWPLVIVRDTTAERSSLTVLSRHLGLKEPPAYIPAHVNDGRVRIWAGKHKAPVDTPGELVDGLAFLVNSRLKEDSLRFYETDKYEVVRCQIVTHTGAMLGLTFRFRGKLDELH